MARGDRIEGSKTEMRFRSRSGYDEKARKSKGWSPSQGKFNQVLWQRKSTRPLQGAVGEKDLDPGNLQRSTRGSCQGTNLTIWYFDLNERAH
ncbi:Dbf4-Type Zinc Finger-Containing Protein 2 [Manis pentadactyla]|nr:Dbf4-Type Zinc Finger-Containing Protein 2 [Manis pentadactyla]